MRQKGLSDATVALRLAGLSSFFDFVCRDYTIIDNNGREVPLYDLNPVSSRNLRKRVKPYRNATYLQKDEIRLFLNAINRNTVQGLRDYALFLTYILTGRRGSEIRNLKYGDIYIEDGRVLYKWHGKNVEFETFEMARSAYDAIMEFLKVSGKLEIIKKDDYIFSSLNEWDQVEQVDKETNQIIVHEDKRHPLTLKEIGKLLKKYCRYAGIEKKITLHSLRHSAAMMRRSINESIEDVGRFLRHSKISSTIIYCHALEGVRDENWKKVETLLDLS